MTTSGMESQSASIATSIDTWQRNASQRRKKTSDDALNVIKKSIAKECKGAQLMKKYKV